MKRFDINEKVLPVKIPSKNWGQKPRYEPYEKVIQRGKYWQSVYRDDNGKKTYFLEHRYTKEQCNFLDKLKPMEGLTEIRKAHEEMEERPIEYQNPMQSRSKPKPGQIEIEMPSGDELRKAEIEQMRLNLEKSFKDIKDRLAAGKKENDEHKARLKLQELKESMAELEKLIPEKPEPDPEPKVIIRGGDLNKS